MAHIGALKLLDSLQIPIDYIAGTSMGGIAAALYAIGYSGHEIEKITAGIDWESAFRDLPPREKLPYILKQETSRYQVQLGFKDWIPVGKGGLIAGQSISLLLSQLVYPYGEVIDFDDLPIPFRCTAVDLITGKLVVLQKGSLAKAMRSTMSIPSVFSPVEWGDSLLVDGGLLNNLPADIVRAMGADIVIAVGVGNALKNREQLRTTMDVLSQSFNLMRTMQLDRFIQDADIYINAETENYSAADFTPRKIAGIIHQGELAAYAKLNELVELKARYNLVRSYSTSLDLRRAAQENRLVYGVSITGNTTLPFLNVSNLVNIKPGVPFNPDTLLARVMEMRKTGLFESVNYEVQPYGDSFVKLIIRVKEKQKPTIYGVRIRGNRILPFEFIYRLIDIKPGDEFDTDMVEERITTLYSLGYFETIDYTITPVDYDHVRLTINVKEQSLTQLWLGFQYGDQYNLVIAANLQHMNLPIPGLRVENEFRFIGYNQYHFKAYYPSRTLDFPVYPFVQAGYFSKPVNIYGFDGKKIASYKDRSTSLGFGLGILDEKFWNLEAEYKLEYPDIKPEIALPDTAIFPAWNENIHAIDVNFHLDLLDDVYDPHRGISVRASYEDSRRDLGSALEYRRAEVFANGYLTFAGKHTVRFGIFHGQGTENLPVYKYFYTGGPETFIGVNYDQLSGNTLTFLRWDYTYHLRKNLRLSFVMNKAVSYGATIADEALGNKTMWGYGLGCKYLTPLGPIELIYARGEKSIYQSGNKRNLFYFRAGYRF